MNKLWCIIGIICGLGLLITGLLSHRLLSAFVGFSSGWIILEATSHLIRKKKERNPMHYCLACDKYLGFRGFCSQECHDKFYDNEPYVVADEPPKNEVKK